MARDDWTRVIDEARALGVRMVQFIGGEPLVHPTFADLVRYALGMDVQVEVFSSLMHVPRRVWQVLGLPGVRVATSYYSDQASQHDEITGQRGSFARTRANIVELMGRSIPLRVGVIDVGAGQRVEPAIAELTALGVTTIDTDRLRQVGRGGRPSVAELCGRCARGKVAVSASGDVWPCVFARWMPVGNVRESSLGEILSGDRMAAVCTELRRGWVEGKCSPDTKCDPAKSDCEPHCPPGYHSDPKRCWPYYYPDDR